MRSYSIIRSIRQSVNDTKFWQHVFKWYYYPIHLIYLIMMSSTIRRWYERNIFPVILKIFRNFLFWLLNILYFAFYASRYLKLRNSTFPLLFQISKLKLIKHFPKIVINHGKIFNKGEPYRSMQWLETFIRYRQTDTTIHSYRSCYFYIKKDCSLVCLICLAALLCILSYYHPCFLLSLIISSSVWLTDKRYIRVGSLLKKI